MRILAEESIADSGRICLEGIEKGLRVFIGTDKYETAKELAVLAYLANLDKDKRLIIQAIGHYAELEDYEMLKNLLQIARMNCDFKAVQLVGEVGREKGIAELLMPDFNEWLRKAIVWFDLYIDKDLSLAFIKPQDEKLIKRLTENMPEHFWQETIGLAEKNKFIKPERILLLRKLSKNENPAVLITISGRSDIDERFRNYCEENSLAIWKRLQSGADGLDQKSNVYLVRDHDGIFKIFKEMLNYQVGPLAESQDNEDEIYRHLPAADFLPRYYGIARVDSNLNFARTSFVFGHLLSDYCRADNLLSVDETSLIIKKIAQKLLWLHEHRVLYLDLKPDNMMLENNDVKLLDLGLSKILDIGQEETDAILTDPKYSAPEIGIKRQATIKSSIFQLGIIFYQMLTGKHPFDLYSEDSIDSNDWQDNIYRYFWPTMGSSCEFGLIEKLKSPRLEIIKRMLDAEPENRPELQEVIECLENLDGIRIKMSNIGKVNQEGKTILFPARMGLPHKGHIEYILRLLYMGFKVVISLQRAYTITDRDPIPKWLVMKIIAQSLMEKGFSEKQFSFILTPFYQTAREHAFHFQMMPGWDKISAVASSNPDVHKLFPRHEIFDQRSVFGIEGEEYFDRSWGERLRTAVKQGDYQTFKKLAASATEKIISFEELRKVYHQPDIEFVPGKVIVKLVDGQGGQIVSGRVYKYLPPEQSLVRHLKNVGIDCELLSQYSKNTIVLYNNKIKTVRYIETIFDGKDETIIFQ